MLPVEPISVTGQVLEAIAHLVSTNGARPGDRLPTERELADRLKVSRSSVRRALQHWERLGIVERRQGSGTYLRALPERGTARITLTVNLEREALLRIHEVRRALETEAAELAAMHATPPEIDDLRAKLERMERVRARDGRAPEEDWEFHLAVYRCTHNPLFQQIFENMKGLFHRFFERPLGIEGFASRSFELHRELYEAIADHDPARARRVTRQILSITQEDLERGRPSRDA